MQAAVQLTPKWQVHQLFSKNKLLFTDVVRGEFVKAYPGLGFVLDDETKVAKSLLINSLSQQAVETLRADIQSFINNPNVPTRLITANLDRFGGSAELLDQAKRAVACSGAVLVGPPDIGKSYLAAAIARHWVLVEGMELCTAGKEVAGNQVWLVTDFQPEQREYFCDVLRKVHHLGCRLIVTATQKLDLSPYYERRLQAICAARPTPLWDGDLFPQNHSPADIEQLKNLFAFSTIVTPAVTQQLKLCYPALLINNNVPDCTFLPSPVVDALTNDLAFFITFPGVPVGHVGSRISTFKNDNQFLPQVKNFAKRTGTRALFLSGPTGSGKTHLAVGLAKRFYNTYHDRLYFVTPDSAKGFLDVQMAPNQFWIFDDVHLHGAYLVEMVMLLQKAIVHAHTHGGMLLVTSCFSWDQIVETCAKHGHPLNKKIAQSLFFSN